MESLSGVLSTATLLPLFLEMDVRQGGSKGLGPTVLRTVPDRIVIGNTSSRRPLVCSPLPLSPLLRVCSSLVLSLRQDALSQSLFISLCLHYSPASEASVPSRGETESEQIAIETPFLSGYYVPENVLRAFSFVSIGLIFTSTL